MDEYKTTGDLGKAIQDGSAGARSALTFGLISQETFSESFDAVGGYWDTMVCGTAELADKAWQGVKSIIPTSEGMKRVFNKLGDDLSPLKDIHIPEELSFAEIKKSVSSMAGALNESFCNITGINLGETFTNIKNSVLGAFDDIALPSFSDIKDKISGIGDSLVSGFKSVGGWFSDIISGGETAGGLAAAEAMGVYKAEHGLVFSGDSEIDRAKLKAGVKSGKIGESILQAILDDKDMNEEDTEFTKELLKLAKDGGSLHTHDHGLHDKFDRIFGTVDNRSAAILGAGINRGMMAMGGGGPALVSAPINNINNSRTDTTVTTTELTHPSPLLNSVNIAA
jgi:hypothetical protein